MTDLDGQEREALDLRMSNEAITDAERALAELHGPDKPGLNTVRRLNEAAFLGERYAQALVEDWKTMRAALAVREEELREDEPEWLLVGHAVIPGHDGPGSWTGISVRRTEKGSYPVHGEVVVVPKSQAAAREEPRALEAKRRSDV
jgi:hypothetical protein